MAISKEILGPLRVRDPGISVSRPEARLGWLLGGIFILALGLLPVYLFPSGRPQLVDGPLLILLAAYFLRRKEVVPDLRRNVTPLLPFIVWAVLVNVIYFLWQPSDYLPLLKSAELVYTFLIFLAFSSLFRDLLEAGNLGLLYGGIFLSILLIFTVKGYSEEGIRSALSFNNPNQLGYYALILTGWVALLLHFKEKSGHARGIFCWGDVVLLFLAHFLALLSLSRGAILGLFLVDIWIFPRLTKRILVFMVPVILLALIALVWQPDIIQERLAGRPGREMTPETVQSEVQGRIFYQLSIMKGVDYLVGRGGRSLTLQDKARGIGEVHNIFGEVFRCYGLIGLVLFSFWLAGFIWRSRVVPGGWFIWGALLIYNMTHYGLRFRFFWILMAFLNVIIYYEKRRIKEELTVAL